MATKRQSDPYEYMLGFGNHFTSEALPDALPKGQNTPQRCPYGLYAEQLSGTGFTTRRLYNKRTWFYRIHPSVKHIPFVKVSSFICDAESDRDELFQRFVGAFNSQTSESANSQFRWSPFDIKSHISNNKSNNESIPEIDFVDGLQTICGAGDTSVREGVAIYVYAANSDMKNKAFYSSDVPQLGTLDIQTEFGKLRIEPNEIAVIQQGMRFTVNLIKDTNNVHESADYCRGYVLETFSSHFELPDLGPIGSNGLANPRDFKTPVAFYEDKRNVEWDIVAKFQGELFVAKQDHSPYDVVAWHGNYTPYKYDLENFCVVNSVSFDHIDPSIFTVLTSRSGTDGPAADFVIFPPRFEVHKHTFRPPYFHRNCMSEFMGLIKGAYEGKEGGFLPGGASLHNTMTPHGPDAKVTEMAIHRELNPGRVADGTMAFMFESKFMLRTTKWALKHQQLQHDYYKAWQSIPVRFDPTNRQV
ncbi:hypothetical protein H4219_000460 [Mycoemilia scoparia]|uniref:homogentisate 1,2-dioxygenase n=1 Tax=Mycoemilia scoparia TaxID=417184 RepID=A0A9W8A313_9FUNG|nr:hypothetical protein H4219_000460 [Mycoemilia scoparia]